MPTSFSNSKVYAQTDKPIVNTPTVQPMQSPTNVYTVQRGDTVNAIAQKLGVLPNQISGYRSGDPNLIVPGEQLNIGQPSSVITKNLAPTQNPPTNTITNPSPTLSTPSQDTYKTPSGATVSGEGETITPAPLQEAPSKYSSPVAAFSDIYKKAYQDLGLSDIKNEYDKLSGQYAEIQTAMDSEISDVDNNPWISEGTRNSQKNKIKDKYDRKTEILNGKLKIYNDLYESGRQEAQFVTQQAVNSYYKEQDYNQQLYLKTLEQAQKSAEESGRVLSASEAKALGVPFGTKAGEAYGITPKTTTGKTEGTVTGLSQNLDLNSPTYVEDLLKSTAGRKAPNQIETLKPITKSIGVINQLQDLQSTIANTKTGPVLGYLKSLNPYDFDARAVQAQLQSIVPNLARGVYGEVGVLTDQDIRNYIQTLPNIESTAQQNDFVMAMTLKTVQRNLETQLETLASAGYDVSGFLPQYNKIKSQVSNMENKLKIGSGPTTGEDEAIFNSVVPTKSGGGYFQNLFNALIGN